LDSGNEGSSKVAERMRTALMGFARGCRKLGGNQIKGVSLENERRRKKKAKEIKK
jgi:hypothetical protein